MKKYGGVSVLGLLILCTTVFAESEYRLPKSVVPEHYDLKVLTHLDPKENFTFFGSIKIQLNVLEDTKSIILHSYKLSISEDKISVKSIPEESQKAFKVTNVTYDKTNDFFIIDLDNALEKGHKYELNIPFKGVLESLLGYYRSSYIDDKTGEKEWLSVTQFEAINARRAFPCFDEPALKATFSIILGRKEGYSSLSNMPLVETKPIDNMKGWFWDVFEKSVPMSTYLVAYMVSKFEYMQSPTTDSSILFKIWARKNAVNQTHYASQIGPKILAHYEKYFDLPYPLPKQDMVAIPDFKAGAMENWGLITYRETALLYSPNVSSTTSKYRVASVVAHELAHQWFGNLVTMKWWTDLWLNEGFATYVSTLGVGHVHPEWNVVMEDAADNMVDVFRLDALNTSHPISIPIGHPNEIEQIFDAISYKKGSTIIRMMNIFLGEEVFRTGVSNYLKKFKYNNAEQDDLWQSLTEAAHAAKVFPSDMTVKQIMDSWTTQIGYPLITVKRNYEANSAVISQTHYKGRPDKNSPSQQKWWVPISFGNAETKNFNSVPSHWLKAEPSITIENIAKPDSWVLFNIDMSGLYKINYDIKNWELLITSLRSPNYKKIPTLNRYQLLIDSMDLAWTGQLEYDLALRVMQYVSNEDEYLPWSAATHGLERLLRILQNTPEYGLYKKYLRILLEPSFKKLGGLNTKVINTPDKLDAVKHQVLVSSWSCRAGVPECVANARELFQSWMNESNPDVVNNIPSDLRSQVYCIGIKKGDEKEWEFLWQRYLKTNIPSEKFILLKSLACTKEIWLLKRYLLWSIDENSGIKQQDSSTVFDSIAVNEVGFYVAKSFLFDKTLEIVKYHKDLTNVMGRYASSIASHISTKQEFTEFSDWLEKYKKELSGGSIAIKQSVEYLMIRLDWVERHFKTVIGVLKNLTKV